MLGPCSKWNTRNPGFEIRRAARWACSKTASRSKVDRLAKFRLGLAGNVNVQPGTIEPRVGSVTIPSCSKSHAALLRVWINALLKAIMKLRHRVEKSTLMLLDKAAQLGAFPPVEASDHTHAGLWPTDMEFLARPLAIKTGLPQ